MKHHQFHTNFDHPGNSDALGIYIEEYDYDAVGNFKAMRHFGSDPAHPGWTRSYAYNEPSLLEPIAQKSNRLTKTTVSNGSNFVEAYTYTDALGNDVHGCMTAINSMKMRWDFEDQLAEVDLQGGGTAYYVYDAAGQRVRKVIERNGATMEERIYLGGYEIYRKRQGGVPQLERQTLHVMDDKQRIALVETRTIDTVGNDPAPSHLIRYQIGNHLGSAALELDNQAQVISYEEYHPYGSTAYQAARSQTETPKRYRYTGKEHDEESGFYYHGARYYAPWLGRWTATDPAGFVDGTNRYAYTRNNPVILVDRLGREGQSFNEESEVKLVNKKTGKLETVEQSRRVILAEVTIVGNLTDKPHPPTTDQASGPSPATRLSPDQLREKVALLPFFFGGVAWSPSMGLSGSSPRLDWSQYVRTQCR